MLDVKHFRRINKLRQGDLAEYLGVSQAFISQIEKGQSQLPDSLLDKIAENRMGWTIPIGISKEDNSIIPYYDVRTIGGRDQDATTEAVTEPDYYINAGDFFRGATAAFRHGGDSMKEYPSGCVLVVKEVVDRRLLMNGRTYVIETSEYRVTKQVQMVKEGYLTAYSSNTETYPDGRLVYAPFDIPMDAVLHISLVMGYVVAENGGAIVMKNQKELI